MDTPEIILHVADYNEVVKESIGIYINKNLAGKMDSYIKKHEKPNSPVRVELTVKKEKDGKASGKLVLSVWPKAYRSEREKFDKLDDLVNHLFTHVKEQMAK